VKEMKMNKWWIIGLIMLLSLSQGRFMLEQYFHMLGNKISPENPWVFFPTLFVVDMTSGFFRLIANLWEFLLSWQGVLLIAVIFAHINWRHYLNKRKEIE
jgi:hypothetical protein